MPFVTHAFSPFNIHSSPSREAVTDIAAASEPTPGSVNKKAPKELPSTSPGKVSDRRSPVAFLATDPAKLLWQTSEKAIAKSIAAISSNTLAKPRALTASPPSASGTRSPVSRCLAALSKPSLAKRRSNSHCSAWSATKELAQSVARSIAAISVAFNASRFNEFTVGE